MRNAGALLMQHVMQPTRMSESANDDATRLADPCAFALPREIRREDAARNPHVPSEPALPTVRPPGDRLPERKRDLSGFQIDALEFSERDNPIPFFCIRSLGRLSAQCECGGAVIDDLADLIRVLPDVHFDGHRARVHGFYNTGQAVRFFSFFGLSQSNSGQAKWESYPKECPSVHRRILLVTTRSRI